MDCKQQCESHTGSSGQWEKCDLCAFWKVEYIAHCNLQVQVQVQCEWRKVSSGQWCSVSGVQWEECDLSAFWKVEYIAHCSVSFAMHTAV